MSHRPTQRAVSASLILSALLLSAGLTGCGKTDTVASLTAEAKQYEAKGDNKAALIQLKNAASKAPDDAEVRIDLATLYLKMGDPVSAEKEARKAGDLKAPEARTIPLLTRALVQQGDGQKALDVSASLADSKNADLLAARGDAFLSMNESEKAGSAYRAAVAVAPGQTEALLGMARLAAIAKDWDGAAKFADQAVAANPRGGAEAYLFKGNLLRAQGKNDEAIAAFSEAVKVRPDMSAALLERANVYMSIKKYDLAKSDITAARKFAPNALPALYSQAVLDFSQNNYTAANDSVLKVLSKAPDHMPSILLAGAIELNLGSYKLAEQHLSSYVSANPSNVYARKLLAQTQLRSAQPASAGTTLAPLLQSDSGDAQVMALAGESSLRAQDFGKATQYFEKATVLAPQASALRTSLGLSMLAQGNQEQGVSELEKAIALDPKSEPAGVALVRSELALRHYDKALAAAKAVVAAHPENADLRNLEGGAYLAKGDSAAARASFEKAASMKPDLFSPVINLAKLDVADKKPDLAKARLVAFAEKNKGTAPLLALAALAASQKNTAEATTWMEKAVADNPDDVAAGTQLISHYIATKQVSKALTMARKLQSANPSNLQLLDVLGQAQMASDDKVGALDTYSKLAGAMPKSAGAHLRLAAVHIKLNNTAAASEDLKRALAIEPSNERALMGQIELAMAAKKPDEALSLARNMQKTLPKSGLGFVVEGDLQTALRKHDLALRAYEQADAIVKNGASAVKVAGALRNAGKAKESEAKVMTWLASHPNDPLPTMFLSELMLTRKDFKGASDRLEAILPLAPNDPVLLNNLAWAYQQQKDPRALPMAERALKAAPEAPSVLDTIGWMLVEQGNTARGVPLLQKAVDAQPENRDLRYHLAVGLAKSGDKKSARQELDKVLAGNAPFAQADQARALLKTL